MRFAVRSDRKRRMRFDLLMGLGGFLLGGSGLLTGRPALPALFVIGVGIWYVVRGLRRLRQRDSDDVELTEEGLLARQSPLARDRTLIPYSSVTALTDAAGGRLLFVGTDDILVVIDGQGFESGSIVELSAALQARILALPDNTAQIKRIQSEQGRIEALERRPTWVTRVVLFGIAFGFFLQITTGGLEGDLNSALVNARLGANVPAMVLVEGEWYRLASAGFLHGHWLHLGMNALFLYLFGGLVERIVGGWRMAFIYLGSCLFGSLASLYLSGADLALGASTGLFGLLGALAVIQLRFRKQLPLGFRQSPRWWVFSLGANALIPLALPFIDGWAHLGGFLGGALLALLALGSWRKLEAFPAPAFALSIGAAVLAGGTLALLGQARQAAVTFEPARFMRAMATYPKTSDTSLNAYAWILGADNPDASIGLLNAAKACAEAAVKRSDVSVRYNAEDTLATVRHRLGDDAGAIEAERHALAGRLTAPEPEAATGLLGLLGATAESAKPAFYGTQLLRFLRARSTDFRTVKAGGSAEALRAWIDAEEPPVATGGPPKIEGLKAPITYLAAWDPKTDAPVGVLLVRGAQLSKALGPDAPPAPEWRIYLETEDGPELALEAGEWLFMPIDPEATKLPRRREETP